MSRASLTKIIENSDSPRWKLVRLAVSIDHMDVDNHTLDFDHL